MKPRKSKSPRPRLSKYKAARAIAKGAKPATVAKAAGSKAKSRKKLRETGARLIRELRDKGQIAAAFARENYDVERFAREVVQQTQATKISRVHHEGELVAVYEDIDWSARERAREQFARTVGLIDLPIADAVHVNVLQRVDDNLLVRLASGEANAQEIEALAQIIGQPGETAGGGAAARRA